MISAHSLAAEIERLNWEITQKKREEVDDWVFDQIKEKLSINQILRGFLVINPDKSPGDVLDSLERLLSGRRIEFAVSLDFSEDTSYPLTIVDTRGPYFNLTQQWETRWGKRS